MTRDLRILLCTPEYVPTGSGIANVVSSLARALRERGVKATVLAPAALATHTKRRQPPGILGLALYWYRAIRYSRRRSREYDVVWFQQPFIIFPGVLNSLKRPIVLTWHATYFGLYRAHLGYRIWSLVLYYLLARNIEKVQLEMLSASKARLVVTAVSPPAMDELHENGCHLKIIVIPNASRFPNGVSISKTEARARLRTRWGIQAGDNDKIILSVGRVTPGKRPLDLLRFFKAMQRSDDRVKLIIVGGGILLPTVRSEAKRMNGVFAPGFVPDTDLPIFYQASDLFMSLSPHEAFNLTAIEASSFGLRVALSNIPSHRWLVESGRVQGITISGSTVPSDVLKLLHSPKKDMGAGSQAGLNWGDVADSYIELITTIAKNPSSEG